VALGIDVGREAISIIFVLVVKSTVKFSGFFSSLRSRFCSSSMGNSFTSEVVVVVVVVVG